MSSIEVNIVTVEGTVLATTAEFIRARGADGELGILPHHIPLMTPLKPGEIMVRSEGKDEYFFVSGGFLQVRPDRVTILADTAERAENIDERRAEEARKSAEEALANNESDAEAASSLERALFRLKVAEVNRHRHQHQHDQQPPSSL